MQLYIFENIFILYIGYNFTEPDDLSQYDKNENSTKNRSQKSSIEDLRHENCGQPLQFAPEITIQRRNDDEKCQCLFTQCFCILVSFGVIALICGILIAMFSSNQIFNAKVKEKPGKIFSHYENHQWFESRIKLNE